jgi:hypothetical protein
MGPEDATNGRSGAERGLMAAVNISRSDRVADQGYPPGAGEVTILVMKPRRSKSDHFYNHAVTDGPGMA